MSEIPQQELIDIVEPVIEVATAEHLAKRDRLNWDPMSVLLEHDLPEGMDKFIMHSLDADPNNIIFLPEHHDKELFVPIDGNAWIDEGKRLNEVQKSGLFTNGLTEDNEAHYTKVIYLLSHMSEVLTKWNNIWTADEDRHKNLFDMYSLLTQTINPSAMEWARRQQIGGGEVPTPENIFKLFIYTTIQEEATRISHKGLNRILPNDSRLKSGLGKTATDEGMHREVYDAAANALVELYPNEFIVALEKVISNFEMPGTGIVNFKKHEAVLGYAGVLDVTDIFNIMNKYAGEKKWDVFNKPGLRPEAVQAQQKIHKRLRGLRRLANSIEIKRQKNGPAQLPSPWRENDVILVKPPDEKKLDELVAQ